MRFDVTTLRDAAGEKVFARGVAYQRAGQVEIIFLEKTRVLAKVLGTEIYRVELRGERKQISGACSCPAFSDWGFCKHMVAAALAVNANAGDGPSGAGSRLSRIRAHLVAQGVQALADRIMA